MTSNSRNVTAKHYSTNQGCGFREQELDATKRDRFELLSAYLDGEVTADERRQVNHWLSNDQDVQCLYQRLLQLRRGIEKLPVPTAAPVETTIQQVFARLQRQFRIALMAGAGTAAVICLGTMSGFFDDRPGIFRFAQVQSGDLTHESVLEVALDEPVIEIPKATVAPDSLSGGAFNIQ